MLPINIPINEFDKSLLIFINQFHNPILDKIVVSISNIGEYAIVWVIIALLLALTNKKNAKKFLLIFAVALVIEVIFNDGIIKNTFFRERPYLALNNIYHVGLNWTNSSFVSGHTASSVVASIVISLYFRKMILPCTIITLIMIYTRFYLGMHYPSDIIGGIIIGAAATLIAFRLTRNSIK